MAKTRKLLLEYETEEVGRLARSKSSEKKALVKAFSDSSDIVRERALLASIEVADPNLVTDITKALTDDVPDVRIAAAQALAFYHQPVTIPNLIRGLKDDSTWVRSHCAAGLSKVLNGPIWARIPIDDVDKIIEDFPEMTEEEVDSFLNRIKMKPASISRFKVWREKEFDVEIDTTKLEEELEAKPILLSEEALAEVDATAKGTEEEIEAILAELPDELRETLPPEDVKRLTPESARELVRQLKVSVPEEPKKKKKKKKKKKAVKVKKVKKVKKKKKPSEKDKLIEKLPEEVRDSVGQEALEDLSVDELEALLSSAGESEPEAEKEDKPDDPRMVELQEKFGQEKAEILIEIPEPMLKDIPEEQIQEMDLDTLKGLAQALEPR